MEKARVKLDNRIVKIVLSKEKKRCRERVRVDVKMMGKGSYLFLRYCPILLETCAGVGVCGVLVYGLRRASPWVLRMASPLVFWMAIPTLEMGTWEGSRCGSDRYTAVPMANMKLRRQYH
jgi:hypothetical protein